MIDTSHVRIFLLVAALVCGSQAFAQGTVIRVIAGGSTYTDSGGNIWSADTGYNAGAPFPITPPIGGTSDPTLYTTGRYDSSAAAPNLQYSFAVPNGWYEVRLHFAELMFSPGGRIFSVQIEGITAFENLDVSQLVGIKNALIKTFTTRVIDGELNIHFLYGAADNPFVNAIEVLSTSAPSTPAALSVTVASGTQVNLAWSASTDDTAVTGYSVERCQGVACTTFAQIATPGAATYVDSGLAQSTYRYRVRALDGDGNTSAYSGIVSAETFVAVDSTILRINAGGGIYTDSGGKVWSADTGYNVGVAFTNAPPISGTSDSSLYLSGRYNTPGGAALQYSFALPNGWYEVKLHFAEPFLPAGDRKFNVQLEGDTAFANLDVSAEAGGVDSALIKTATTHVTDGQLNVLFLHGAIENPFINAIEVVQTATPDTQAPSIPAGIAAVPLSSTRVDLSWSASSDDVGVTGYRLERCAGAACTNFMEVETLMGTSLSQTGLSPGTYRYRLRATDAAGNFSAYSSAVSVTLYVGADALAPTAPADLTVTVVSPSQVALSWTASTDNVAVTQYRIERCKGAGCTTFLQIGTATGTTYNDNGLGAGLLYRYRVRAADAVPNLSVYSSVVSATTLAGSGDTDPPSAPGSPGAEAYSANRIDVHWIASTDNVAVTGYFVERCIGASCANFSQIAVHSATTSYSDTGLTGGTSYRYRIRARDADNNLGAYSSITTTTTLVGTGTAGSTTYQYDSFGRLKQVTVVPN